MSNTKFCPSCGHPHNAGEQVCSQCGAPLPPEGGYGQSTQQMAPPMQGQPMGQPMMQGQPPMGQPPMGQPMMQGQPPMGQPMMPPAQNKTNIVLISIIAFLVVVIVGGVVWFLVKDKDEPAATEQVATIPNIDTVAPATDVAVAEPAAEEKVEPVKPAKKSSPYDYSVSGSIGKYKIQMQISINGGTITGRYRYIRMNGAGGWLKLSGYTSGSSFEMYEENSSGEVTGTFEGTFNKSDSYLSMSGTMWNYKGDSYSYNVSGSSD